MSAPRSSGRIGRAWLILGLGLGGCAPEVSTGGFDAPDPASRAYAIESAALRNDQSDLLPLIQQLDSDDPLVRMMAITALQRLTGETHGYRHFDPPEAREPAIRRWMEAAGQPQSAFGQAAVQEHDHE